MAQTMVKNNMDMQKSKPKSSNAGVVVVIILLILALVGAGLCYWFNVFGIKNKVLTLMGKEPVVEMTQEERFAQMQIEIDTQQAALDQQKAELEQQKAEVESKLADIKEREQKYLVDKAEFDSLYEAFEQRKMDVKDVAKIYEQMDAAVAAEILVKYADKNEVARIISNLTDTKAAEVLTEMDAKYASDLLRVID